MLLTAMNSHTLVAVYLPRCVLFNSHMRQNAFYRYLKWNFEDLLPCYCYAMKTYSRKNHWPVWPPASATLGTDMSELQAHQCITPKQWTWLMCSVSVILVNKLSLQNWIKRLELSCWFQLFKKIFVLSSAARSVDIFAKTFFSMRYDQCREEVCWCTGWLLDCMAPYQILVLSSGVAYGGQCNWI